MSDLTPPPAPEPAPIPQSVPQAAPLPPSYGAPQSLAPKEVGVAYLFMLLTLVGVAGAQHFYLGKIGRGFLWLLTFGLLGIGTLIDIFTLPAQTRQVNAQRAVGIK